MSEIYDIQERYAQIMSQLAIHAYKLILDYTYTICK